MKYLAIILIAAIIGYVTNFLAIKMLFRPYKKKKLWKIPIPFTPGIIPKNRNNIARKLSEMMASNVLTNDILANNILSDINIEGTIKDFFLRKEDFEVFNANIKNQISKMADIVIRDLAESGFSSKVVSNIIEGIRPKLGFFGGMVDSFSGVLEEKVDNYLRTEGKVMIDFYLNKKYDELSSEELNKIQDNDIYIAIKPIFSELIKKAFVNLDLQKIMEEQINNLDIKSFEKMLLSVLKKELRAITYLGAILGAIIGCLNILFI